MKGGKLECPCGNWINTAKTESILCKKCVKIKYGTCWKSVWKALKRKK